MTKKKYPMWKRKSAGFPLIIRINGKRYRYAHVARKRKDEAEQIATNMRKDGWNIHIARQKSIYAINRHIYRLYKRRKK